MLLLLLLVAAAQACTNPLCATCTTAGDCIECISTHRRINGDCIQVNGDCVVSTPTCKCRGNCCQPDVSDRCMLCDAEGYCIRCRDGESVVSRRICVQDPLCDSWANGVCAKCHDSAVAVDICMKTHGLCLPWTPVFGGCIDNWACKHSGSASSCAYCDPETGDCTECRNKYYLEDGRCLPHPETRNLPLLLLVSVILCVIILVAPCTPPVVCAGITFYCWFAKLIAENAMSSRT